MNGLGTACTVFTSRVLGSPYVQEQNDPARQVQHVAAQSKDVHRHDAFSWPGRLFLVGIMAAASKQERRMLDDAEKLPKENLSPILIASDAQSSYHHHQQQRDARLNSTHSS